MPIDMNLVKKGTRCSRAALLNQTLYHIELERKYRGALHAAGWRPIHTDQLVSQFEFLKANIHEAADARADSQTNTQNEQQAIDDSKAYKRKLLYAFADLFAEGRVLEADYKLVRESGTLHRSTPKFIAYFAKIRGQVMKYDADLTPYLGAPGALALFDAVQSQLEAAQATQETDLAALPHETLKIYETMGRLLSLIEKMNRVAKIAFDGQAHTIAEFNKDLLLRARKPRKSSTVEPVAGAPSSGDCEETG